MRSAAWRISLWATLAFACGTVQVAFLLHHFVAQDIQRRSDAWLAGEVKVLRDVLLHTPKEALHDRVVGEVTEMAGNEVPDKTISEASSGDSVFFLQTARDGSVILWVGAGDGKPNFDAIQASRMRTNETIDLKITGFTVPFRVVSIQVADGTRIYLGLSERYELRVLRNLRLRFALLWMLLVLFGFVIVFMTTRSMLSHVREITDAASRIGRSDLSSRVPLSTRGDEVAQLALTLNHMLDRIESAVHQLHTITGSLAHDLRSPLTAIRVKLESSLSTSEGGEQAESIVFAIDELDRLTDFLNKSLDVAEAQADALRLNATEIDLDELVRMMIDLYEPSLTEKDHHVTFDSAGPLKIVADNGLIRRMIANLFDNELRHLPSGANVSIRLQATESAATLVVQDDGPGFSPEVRQQVFKQRVKGNDSNGHGLGLAFVEAVVRAHGGTVAASNREGGGAQIAVSLPLASSDRAHPSFAAISGSN